MGLEEDRRTSTVRRCANLRRLGVGASASVLRFPRFGSQTWVTRAARPAAMAAQQYSTWVPRTVTAGPRELIRWRWQQLVDGVIAQVQLDDGLADGTDLRFVCGPHL